MVLLMMLVACDTDGSVNAIKLPKCHIALHLNYLDLRNTMLSLTTLSATHDARAGLNCVP